MTEKDEYAKNGNESAPKDAEPVTPAAVPQRPAVVTSQSLSGLTNQLGNLILSPGSSLAAVFASGSVTFQPNGNVT